MTDRGHRQFARPLIAATAIAVLVAGAAYTFGPDARADRAGHSAVMERSTVERSTVGQAATGRATTSNAAAATAGGVSGGKAAPVTEHLSAAKSCATDARHPKRQLRGVWIATVRNLDWPSRAGLSPKRQRAEYVKILDNAVKRRLNAVFVQVRPASDAIYRSSLEPWSKWLTGKAGKDPGWDPLPFLVEEAHKRGLEFHAWFNPYRAAESAATRLPPGHPARVHPDWTVRHEGNLYYNPGLPEVRDWVTRVVADVVERYDVDGVHFDDYFYPYPGRGTKFADSAAFKKYGRGMKLADWRRDNVNKLVAQVSGAVHEAKPYVKFGISPFGIWRNKKQDPSGSNTTGMSAYDSIYADAKAWIKARTVDYIMPQLYWPRGFPAAAYEVLLPWWANAVKGTGVELYIGQALYRVGSTDTAAWKRVNELPAHLTLNRRYPEVDGDVFFSARYLLTNPLSVLDHLVKEHYRRPALLPLPNQLTLPNRLTLPGGFTAKPPAAPREVRNVDGTLMWRAQPEARAYGVYRVPDRPQGKTGGDTGHKAGGKMGGRENDKADRCATADARNLVAIVPASEKPTYVTKGSGAFYVTALNRLTMESAATPAKPTSAR